MFANIFGIMCINGITTIGIVYLYDYFKEYHFKLQYEENLEYLSTKICNLEKRILELEEVKNVNSE